MKLLFDHNLSPRLIAQLSDLYPAAAHVSDVGLERATDAAVWQYANVHGSTIGTKDADFSDMRLLFGSPPKVIWIRRGNCTTREIASLLRSNDDAVSELHRDIHLTVILLF